MWNRLYQLQCGVQHYPWGGRARDGTLPFIADLLARTPPAGQPFAELWIGAHPRLPAQLRIRDRCQGLDAWIAQYPSELLGAQWSRHGKPALPFLLKILHCEMPLSIQAHPDRALAARLHAAHPEHYPDSSHKPEIAIAVTPFLALCQFRHRTRIRADLQRLEALRRFFAPVLQARPGPGPDWLRQAYGHLFRAPQETIATTVAELIRALDTAAAATAQDRCFLRLATRFPADRGALAAYFLNLVRLQPGTAMFLAAGEPHAYLDGVIVECMANSDNVVRAGLTAKFIDRNTLLDMLTYREGPPRIRRGRQRRAGERCYTVPVPEFQVETWHHAPGSPRQRRSRDTVALLLVLNGTIRIRDSAGTRRAGRGTAWLWPAACRTATFTALEAGTEVVVARPGAHDPADPNPGPA